MAHAVADLDAATALFGGLLGGQQVVDGSGPGHRFVELTWGGPLVLRLLAPTDDRAAAELAGWLGDRAGRLHHLALTADEPSSLPAARPASDQLAALVDGGNRESWEIPPADNLGLRLLVASEGEHPRPADVPGHEFVP